MRMNKLRFLVFGILLVPQFAIAQSASDERMVLEAVWGTIGAATDEDIVRLYEESISEIKLLANNPQTGMEVVGATVVFAQGQTPLEIEQFTNRYSFEAVSAQAKYPSGDQGQVVTMGIEALSLLMVPGTLSERLYRAVSQNQSMIPMARTSTGRYDLSNLGSDRSSRANNADAKIYQLKFVGTVEELNRAVVHEDFLVVSIDHSNRIVDSYTNIVERAAQMPVRSSGPMMIRPKPGQSLEEAILDSLPPGITKDRVIINQPPIPPPLNKTIPRR